MRQRQRITFSFLLATALVIGLFGLIPSLGTAACTNGADDDSGDPCTVSPSGPPPSKSAQSPKAGNLPNTLSPDDLLDICDQAADSAERSCVSGGGVITQMGAMAIDRATRIGGSNGAGDNSSAIAACKAQQKGAKVAGALAVGVGVLCSKAATSCTSACGGSNLTKVGGIRTSWGARLERNRKKCHQYAAAGALNSGMAGVTALDGYNQGKSCEKLLTAYNDCTSTAPGPADDNSNCTERYCKNNNHKFEILCQECAQPNADQNKKCVAQYCAVQQHMTDPVCALAGEPTAPTGSIDPGSLATATSPSITPEGFPTDIPTEDLPPIENPKNPEYEGNPTGTGGTSGKFGSTEGGGSSGGIGGLGAYPGGPAAGQQAAQGGNTNKDGIDHGFNGSGGGYSPGGGTVGDGGGSGAGAGGKGDENIDLSKFLPGGELDPARKLASELSGEGITGANGVSNFEKVTRIMTKKAPVLKPGDG